MASVLGYIGYIPLIGRLVGAEPPPGPAIDLQPVEVHNVDTAPERRARTLKHLLRANHTNHAIMYHSLQFHNHMPHILSSAYLLGAQPHQLYHIYETEAKDLEPWTDSPHEILRVDWREYLGDKRFQRAYIDFFEDSLAMDFGYDWKALVAEYLLRGDKPLVNGLIGGLGHPLIHLGYAFEMDNREVAIEALALTAVSYNFFHKYTDDPCYSRPCAADMQTTSPRRLLERLRQDSRFDGIFKGPPGIDNVEPLFEKHEDLVLEYWNAWHLADPVRQFEESQEAAVALLVATVPAGTHAYNFFVVHLLTTSHAVRILLPCLPRKFHVPLVRQWWLLTLAVYIAELRPPIIDQEVPGDLGGRTWKHAEDRAVNSEWATDAHYVKAIRAMREAARTWGDADNKYLASALWFADDFKGWNF